MKNLQETVFAIVGLGLIGGSYAKALRGQKVQKILGLDTNPICDPDGQGRRLYYG